METKVKIRKAIIGIMIFLFSAIASAQEKQSVAVISIDTKGVALDNLSMGNLVRLELEKTNYFEVLDKYDVANKLEENSIDVNNCFGKTRLVEVGKLLGVEKMVTGNVDKFGDKIIFILRLIDVESAKIEKTDVVEYLNLQDEIQTMARISVNNLIGIENDRLLVDLLINYDRMVSSPKTTVTLNGPRMGAAFTNGETGDRLGASKEQGGYNMYPVTSVFGYQYEFQYLSSGDFQALVEMIGAFSGLESGNFVPSLSIMNGFRFNKTGIELGLGPIFRVARTADGYYDADNNWHLESDLVLAEGQEPEFPIVSAIDRRGNVKLSASMIVAVGKTFRSGYLNIPVNLYFVPRKEGSTIGLIFGFNIANKSKREF